MKLFENRKSFIDTIYNELLSEEMEEGEYLSGMKSLSDMLDKELETTPEIHHFNVHKKSQIVKIFKVQARIRLVKELHRISKNEYDIIQQYSFPGLTTYLTLTCFDQLGQHERGWMFFPDWLSARKRKVEREVILKNVKSTTKLYDNLEINPEFIRKIYEYYQSKYPESKTWLNFFRNKEQISISEWLSSEENIEERIEAFGIAGLKEESISSIDLNLSFLKEVYNHYHKIYGVKNSFFNFLRKGIPESQRNILLNSIKIELYVYNEKEFEFHRYGNEEEKEHWLYNTRNNYTHNLDSSEKHYIEGYQGYDANWIYWEEIIKAKKGKKIYVKETFKDELTRTLIIGMAEIIRKHAGV